MLLDSESVAPEWQEPELEPESALSPGSAGALFEEPSPEEREAAYQAQLQGSLSATEREAVQTTLLAAGFREADLQFHGRMIELGGDAYLDADDLLRERETVEKGQLLSQVETNGGAPHLYARQVDAHTEFWRPDVSFGYRLIVEDNVPQFVMTALQAAATAIANVGSGDCLNGGTFTPIRRTAFNAIDPLVKPTLYQVPVVYSSTACSPSTSAIACALLPRFERHVIQPLQGQTEDRMRFGTRLGIVSTKVTSDTADHRGALIHELLHLMGVVHPQAEQTEDTGLISATVQKIVVHGTQSGTNYPSVMHSTASNPNWQNTLQPDDIKVLLTLYSNYQDGRSPCGYFAGFRTPPLR
jgi:hypothetical protein